MTGEFDERSNPNEATAPQTRSEEHPENREKTLLRIVADVLDSPEVRSDYSFVGLGGDSISAMRLVYLALKAGMPLATKDVLRHTSIAELATSSNTGVTPALVTEADRIGEVTATPIMRALFERGGSFSAFSQASVMRTPARLTLGELVTCLQAIIDTHDALRIRLNAPDDSGHFTLTIPPATDVDAQDRVTTVDASGVTDGELAGLIQEHIDILKHRLAPERAVSILATWFDRGDDRQGRLALLIHHLAVDGVSWRVIQSDLAAAWDAVSRGLEPQLDPVGTPFRAWSRRLVDEASSRRRNLEIANWVDITSVDHLAGSHRPASIGSDLHGSLNSHTLSLPTDMTKPLLSTALSVFNADVNTILLAGFALAVLDLRTPDERIEKDTFLIDVEGHGREDIIDGADVSRTVGWFTSIFPVRFRLHEFDAHNVSGDGGALGKAIEQVKAVLDDLPDNGVGHGLLRYLSETGEIELANRCEPALGFNYLGRFQLGSVEDWSFDASHAVGLDELDPGMPLAHAVEINAAAYEHLSGPVLTATWTWDTQAVSKQEVKALAERWFDMLRVIVRNADRPGVSSLTPSDVRLVSISQTEIDEIELQEQTS